MEHFFLHHKDLEKGKFVKIKGWKNRAYAFDVIIESMKQYKTETLVIRSSPPLDYLKNHD